MKWIKLIIVVALVLAFGAGVYYYSLQQVEFHDVKINDVEIKSLGAFTLIGEVDVYNGGFLRFNVKNITYAIIMEESGNVLTDGFIQGGHLAAGETKTFPFENEIHMMESGAAILNFIKSENTHVRVKGVIILANNIKIPFEKRIDLGLYLEEFTEQNINPFVGADSIEMAKGLVGAIGAAFA